jgi:hypothetical protein
LAPAALALLGIAVSLTEIGSGSVTFARLALAPAAAAGAILVVALLRRDHLFSPAIGAAATLLLTLLLGGHFSAEVTLPVFCAVGFAPLLILLLRWLTPWETRRPRVYQVVALVLLLIPLALFITPLVLQAMRAAGGEDNPYGL